MIVPCLFTACGSPTTQQEDVSATSVKATADSTSRDAKIHSSVKETSDFAPEQVLVKFKKETNPQVIKEIQQKLDLETVRIVSPPHLYLLQIKSGVSVQDMIRLLQNTGDVEYAEPNFERKAQ